MNEAGPFVVAAVFCENVLREVDGCVSAIRMIDGIELSIDGPEPAGGPTFSCHFLVAIRWAATGAYTLRLQIVNPSGSRAPEIRLPTSLIEPTGGAVWNVQLTVQAREEGVYWMEVATEETGPLVRSPLRVSKKRKQPSETPPST